MAAQHEPGQPKCKIELPKPGEDYGGTKTIKESYHHDVSNQIGEGTYGQVFTGQCKRDDTKVALKKIRMDTEKEGFPITAIREIKILSSMNHPNVVHLREIVRSDISKHNNFKGNIYMVFDFAEHDLTGLMDTNKYRFTEAQVKCIMKQLLKGLAYVHGNGVLHRDLKASNILIDKKGIVKLADFGLARTWQEKHDARLTNRVITLWYRPPELLLGAEKYGPEVDMWSVGCILAELLVGKPLFPGKDEVDQLDKIFSIMGTPTPDSWPGVDKLPGWVTVPKGRYQQQKVRQWVAETVQKNKQAPVNPAAVALLEKLLCLDPARRISALDAFQDQWFWNKDPPPCAEADLPTQGSSHEFTMKNKRRHEKEQEHAHGGAGGMPGGRGALGGHMGAQGYGGHAPHGGYGGGQGGGAGGGYPDKRQRYNPPPAGGPSGGYGGQRGGGSIQTRDTEGQ